MVSLIGPPPVEFVQRSETTEQCLDEHGSCCQHLDRLSFSRSANLLLGKWIADEDATVMPTTLEDIESRLEGQEEFLFLKFLRGMLQWLPEERKTAKELLQDPWLQI